MLGRKKESPATKVLKDIKQWAGHISPQLAANSALDLRLQDLRTALQETTKAFGSKDLSMYAAGVAYFATLSLFPFIAAFVALSTLVFSPDNVIDTVKQASNIIPDEMGKLITSQFNAQVDKKAANIFASILAIGLALFGASGAIQNLINALNRAYGVKETHDFIRAKLISISFSIATIIGVFLMGALLTARPELLQFLHIPESIATIILWGRWPLIIILVSLGLSVLYRYGPNRKQAQWQWLTWGAVIATILWLIITILFFIYIQNFANITSTYSVFAGIIVIMMWFNLSATAIILGAQINHRLEVRVSRRTYNK
jgi:membrane protein